MAVDVDSFQFHRSGVTLLRVEGSPRRSAPRPVLLALTARSTRPGAAGGGPGSPRGGVTVTDAPARQGELPGRRAEAEQAWHRLAAALSGGPVPCQRRNAMEWWPEGAQLRSTATAEAIAACGRCPAREACLAYAVSAGEAAGIWGGTLPPERRALRRRINKGRA
ncbi:WhiB family transcriptional regulator [Geodermatophilus nigrescens]